MKKSLILRPDITLKKDYNSSKELSLQILSMNKTDLEQFLKETCFQNPFLTMTATSEEVINYQVNTVSLSDVIIRQLAYIKETISEDVVYYLISNLDSNGYFKIPFEQIVNQSIFTKSQLKNAIFQLQRLDPIGCFCFSLKETLKVQSEMSNCAESETAYILCDYLNLLANKEYNKISTICHMEYEEVMEGFQFIQTLNPKPAAQFSINATYLQPEAKIIVDGENIQIKLLNEDLKLDVTNIQTQKLTEELKQLRYQAKNIMNFIQKRNMTLIQILEFLCDRQKMYFLNGESLRRCTMEEASKACNLHVSTISRAVQDKSIEFNNRYIPIRKLFVRNGNVNYDVIDIKKGIQYWIQVEDKSHPLSDEKISKLFESQGITISRRSVTKYREEANIPNQYERKKENKDESGQN